MMTNTGKDTDAMDAMTMDIIMAGTTTMEADITEEITMEADTTAGAMDIDRFQWVL